MRMRLSNLLLFCLFTFFLGNYQSLLALQGNLKINNSYKNGILVKDIESIVLENPSPPIIRKEYIEKWEISAAKTVSPNSVEKLFLLSSAGYFKFIDGETVLFKLNEQFPEQKGTFYQSPLSIKMYFPILSDCTTCIRELEITRKNMEDNQYKLTFNGMSQFFTVISSR